MLGIPNTHRIYQSLTKVGGIKISSEQFISLTENSRATVIRIVNEYVVIRFAIQHLPAPT